jgi:disulfide bond formation protein DsbB
MVLLAGFAYQEMTGEDPCPLCLLERLAMIGIAIGALLDLRFGIRVEHYGLALLAAFGGSLVSLRQIALHICPGSPTFGSPVLGFSLYVWAFLVFTCSMFVVSILSIMFGFSECHEDPHPWNNWGKVAFWIVAAIIVANIVTTLRICGLSPCAG